MQAERRKFKSDAIIYQKDDIQGGVAYIIYDCSIEDLQERKGKAITVSSACAVTRQIGLKKQNIQYFTSKEAIIKKRRFFSKIHNKYFAIRLAK